MTRDDGRKTDLEKHGLFQQLPYVSDPYLGGARRDSRSTAARGHQLAGHPFKPASTYNAECFSRFQRAFEGEPYRDPERRFWKCRNSQKMSGNSIFHLPGVSQRPEGSGSFYGTFSGPVVAMGTLVKKARSKDGRNKKNIVTSPAKRGCGYGYVGVTFAKYPKHMVEPYGIRESRSQEEDSRPRFQVIRSSGLFGPDPYQRSSVAPSEDVTHSVLPETVARPFLVDTSRGSKPIGTYPRHETDPYEEKIGELFPPVRTEVNDSGFVFGAIPGPKSTRTCSILDRNINKRINRQNCGSVLSVFSWV